MLQQRHVLVHLMHCVVRNGDTASFWFDNWNDMGQLITALGVNGPRQLRIPLEASVNKATSNGHWTLPAARTEEGETLQVVLSTLTPPHASRASVISDDPNLRRSARGVVTKLLFQIIIYQLWKERNRRIFNSTSTTTAAVHLAIDQTTRDRLLSIPVPGDGSSSLLEVYFLCFSAL
ncbi:unnamed protein product [Thlaspi arvense]|uniref:Uncharacterized protein n=1 Tax=Thlaspi arvense TaxID=13288 RepID=A0AAU9T788_THLAR|nr:unnamed protein product [Thlaspi arvense]